ncbi:MAG: hypothetical protein AAB547_02105 [Patescibacteria group bacterium]
MDTKSKALFAIFGILIAGSVVVSYYKFMIARDYIIQAEAECDPYTEACFIWECDPTVEGECTGDPVEDTSYYKLIERNAKNIPLCDPNDEDCDALTCPEGEAECSFTLCDPATAEADGVVCNDPAVYTLENPIEEDEEDTEEEGDAEDSSMEEGDESAAMDDENGADAGDTGAPVKDVTTMPETAPQMIP